MVVVSTLGEGEKGSLLFKGHRVSISEDEKVLRVDDGDDSITM